MDVGGRYPLMYKGCAEFHVDIMASEQPGHRAAQRQKLGQEPFSVDHFAPLVPLKIQYGVVFSPLTPEIMRGPSAGGEGGGSV